MSTLLKVPLLAALLATLAPLPAAHAARRFYVQVRAIQDDDGPGGCHLKAKAASVLAAELAARPDVVTSLGERPPTGARLRALLKRRHMVGYGLFLRVTRCARSVAPNPRRGRRPLLTMNVSTALAAELLPSGQLVTSTHGDATVGVETTRGGTTRELDHLRVEALQHAVRQALDSLLTKDAARSAKRRHRARHPRKRRPSRRRH